MRKLLIVCIITLSASFGHAKALTCNDERDESYSVKIDIQKGKIELFAEKKLIETEYGSFENCSFVGPEVGAVLDQEECDFIPAGGREAAGSITLREDGSAYYNLNLADRNFRGWCQ